jgi:hypothetical protein
MDADGASYLESGVRALEKRLAASPDDDEARFGKGLLLFGRAVERFGQAQFRHGARAPRYLVVPLFRLPVPENPSPEPLTYETQRATLQNFIDDLKRAQSALASVSGEVKIVLDLNAVQFDLTGSGQANPREKLSAILAAMRVSAPQNTQQAQPFEVAFDRADALWLRGYCNVLSALIEFVLAYDWHESFEVSAQLFYPSAVPTLIPRGAQSLASASRVPVGESATIADTLAWVHSVRWPLAEPGRLRAAHGHLKQVVSLSRESWKAILAETDDDREWIPGPHQKNGVLNIGPVTDEIVAGWLSALDEFDAVLDGRKLLPHWRFASGINLKKVLYEPKPFDLLLIASGQGAVPFLERGDTISWETWNRWQRIFNRNFLMYAAWFN